jgi:hypothetical protein
MAPEPEQLGPDALLGDSAPVRRRTSLIHLPPEFQNLVERPGVILLDGWPEDFSERLSRMRVGTIPLTPTPATSFPPMPVF